MLGLGRKNLRISLYDGDRQLREVRSSNLAVGESIKVGRDPDCDWRIRKDAARVSGTHFVLKRTNSGVKVIDRSKNGITREGKRIKSRNLKVGDEINFSEFYLKVELDIASSGAEANPYICRERSSVLEPFGPLNEVKFYVEKSKPLNIGASPDRSHGVCVIKRPGVSRQHARIRLDEKKGRCVIVDTSSKCGTFINGERLVEGKQRVLANGDKVAFGREEAIFYDRAGRRTGITPVRALLVVFLLVSFSVLGLGVFNNIMGKAGERIEKARVLYKQREFAAAEQMLESARGRVGFDAAKADYAVLKTQIDASSQSLGHWRISRTNLVNKNWTAAAESIGKLTTMARAKSAWGWKGGEEVLAIGIKLKRWLDAVLESEGDFREDAIFALQAKDKSELRKRLEGLDRVANEIDSAGGVFVFQQFDGEPKLEFSGLAEEVNDRRTVISGKLSVLGDVDGLLSRLVTADSSERLRSPSEVLADLEALLDSADRHIAARIRSLLPPLKALDTSYKNLLQATSDVQNLNFDRVVDVADGLPSIDSCNVDPALVKLRSNYRSQWDQLRSASDQARIRLSRLTSLVENSSDALGVLAVWKNQAFMSKVLACDTLKLPYVSRSRKEPQGEYDRALRIEYFYNWLQESILGKRKRNEVRQPEFRGELEKSLELLTAANNLIEFFSDRQLRGWMLSQKMKEWHELSLKVVDEGKRLGQKFSVESKKAKGRKAIIYGGISWHLWAGDRRGLQTLDEMRAGLKEHMAAEYEGMMEAISRLEQERRRQPLRQRPAYAPRILSAGLPGVPAVTLVWTE